MSDPNTRHCLSCLHLKIKRKGNGRTLTYKCTLCNKTTPPQRTACSLYESLSSIVNYPPLKPSEKGAKNDKAQQ